jgi:NET1-associated nuclear protein 1 (U3 small nucleolar RNA-associated protein 17)
VVLLLSFFRSPQINRYFFLTSASSVKIFSITTGHVVSTLSANTSRTSPNGPSARITALFLNPQNPFQLFTASSDGYIQLWDFLDAVVLQTITFGLPITHLCGHSSAKGYLFIVVEKATRKWLSCDSMYYLILNFLLIPLANESSSFTVFRISLKPSHGKKASAMLGPSDTLKVGKLSGKPTGFAISPSGSWLVATSGCKAHVAQMSDLSASFTKFISPNLITCLAFHPSEEVFATGDAVGVIRLWYCLDPKRMPWTKVPGDTDRKAPTTTLHWHAHAVSSIAFTPNGAYLLSGGEESVLVVWQLESGHREYLPRLGAPIQSVSVIPSSAERAQEYLLGLVDGSMHLVESNNFKITKTFSQLKHSASIWASPLFLMEVQALKTIHLF